MSIDVRQEPPADEEIAEEWSRHTSEPDVCWVGASRWVDGGDWPWQVHVAAAEFVRDGPLSAAMDAGVYEALVAVDGVTDVAREDTEVWIVAGDPAGADLVRVVASFIDTIRDDIREHIRRLGG